MFKLKRKSKNAPVDNGNYRKEYNFYDAETKQEVQVLEIN